MLPILKILKLERQSHGPVARSPEPDTVMNDLAQIESYVDSYRWDGPAAALLLYHLIKIRQIIRPGDTVIDLACGPGPLLLELAQMHPETQFIGVDLAPNMLEYIESQVQRRGLKNLSTLNADICETPSLKSHSADVVISTSSLHHLPAEQHLERAFKNCTRILKPNGGIYLFDFGLLKNPMTREIMVNEIRGEAGQITVDDYRMSLNAAFPIPLVKGLIKSQLSEGIILEQSRFADFFYFIRTPGRRPLGSEVKLRFKKLFLAFPWRYKLEFLMLYIFKRKVNI